jgi:hypothetical protein
VAFTVAQRRRHESTSAPVPPSWPPISTAPTRPVPATTSPPPPDPTTPAAAAPAAGPAPAPAAAPATAGTAHLAAVNLLAGEVVPPKRWVDPLADGSCPDGYPIKANDNSGIYHVPGGRSYERTKGERCYANVDDAQADGYRAAKA